MSSGEEQLLGTQIGGTKEEGDEQAAGGVLMYPEVHVAETTVPSGTVPAGERTPLSVSLFTSHTPIHDPEK